MTREHGFEQALKTVTVLAGWWITYRRRAGRGALGEVGGGGGSLPVVATTARGHFLASARGGTRIACHCCGWDSKESYVRVERVPREFFERVLFIAELVPFDTSQTRLRPRVNNTE